MPGENGDLKPFDADIFLTGRIKFIAQVPPFALFLSFGGKSILSLCAHPQHSGIISIEDIDIKRFPRGEQILFDAIQGRALKSIELDEPNDSARLYFSGNPPVTMILEMLGRSSNIFIVTETGHVIYKMRELKTKFRNNNAGEPYIAPINSSRYKKYTSCSRECLLQDARLFFQEKAVEEIEYRIKRLNRALDSLDKEEEEAKKWQEESLLARYLVSHSFKKERGRSEIEVNDNGTLHIISLIPALTLLENTEIFFKRGAKAKKRFARLPIRRKEIICQLEGLEDKKKIVFNAPLETLLSKSNKKETASPEKAKRDNLPRGIVKIMLPQGFVAYYGKSASGNEIVTFKIANGEDFWFHCSDYSGSHLIVRNPSRLDSLPEQVLVEASKLAVKKSHAPSGDVRVVYCKRKFVNKPKGLKAGTVFLSSPKYLVVDHRSNK